jgi:hypothetical protein
VSLALEIERLAGEAGIDPALEGDRCGRGPGDVLGRRGVAPVGRGERQLAC